MEAGNKTIEKPMREYNHVTNWERHFGNNILPRVFSWGPVGPPRGHKDYIKFYEGIVEDGGKKALFFLEHDKIGGNEEEYIETNAKTLLANCHYERSKDSNELGSTRFDDSIAASQIFEQLEVPEDLWDKKGLSIMQAYYKEWAKDARITVPGYVSETFFVGDKITSEVIAIPRSNWSGIERELRKSVLNGKIEFW
jgi:hypothetical protein